MKASFGHLAGGTILLAALASLSACQHGSRLPRGGDSTASSSPSTSLTGTLQSGVAAVGGETTGWRLVGDGATGGFDVDVSKVGARAKALDGKRVTVTGRMTTRSFPERGPTQVLVAEKIEPAAPRRGGVTSAAPSAARRA